MKGLALFIVFILSLQLFAIPVSDAESVDSDMILVDYGNGDTEWYQIESGFTIGDTISGSLGMPVSIEDDTVKSVGSFVNYTLPNGQICKWNIYTWDGLDWIWVSDVSEIYAGGHLALGYYSIAGTVPAVTPNHPSAWTSFRGDSSLSANGSDIPEFVATPIEWYTQTKTGGVYSSVLYADGFVYYTTGGGLYAVGNDQSSYTYCVDVISQKTVWSFKNCNYQGYEVTTPLIVGDYIIITSANSHIFCLDRYTASPIAELLPTGSDSYLKDCPHTYYDLTRQTIGKCGPTTSIYDSGALYFNTADGHIRCCTVDDINGFDIVWDYQTPGEQTFYYTPPIAVRSDTGERYLISADEAGNVYCLNAFSGELMWTKNFDSSRVNSLSLCSDGRILAASSTHTYLVSSSDGSILRTSDFVMTAPAVIGGTFYAYIDSGSTLKSHYGKGDITVEPGVYAVDVSTFEYIWVNVTKAYTKSGMVYAQGYLYAMDYNTKSYSPNGGSLRCYDPNSGELLYSVVLDVNSQYSMCTPVVADGRIFVGNDSGTIYVLSEISSKTAEPSEPLKNDGPGLAHWSWITIIAIAGAGLIVAILIYRRTL